MGKTLPSIAKVLEIELPYLQGVYIKNVDANC